MDVLTGEVTSVAIPRIINRQVRELLSYVDPKKNNDAIGNDTRHNSQSTPTETETAYENTAKNLLHLNAAKHLLHLLDKSIQRRVMHAPPPKSQCTSDASVAVLFSGGIDSVILAALSHRHIPSDRPIDLINVSFYDKSDSKSNVVSPDRLAALHSYLEMSLQWPQRNWKFIAVNVSYQEVLEVESKVLRLISPLDSTMDFNIAVAFWFAGRGRGRVVSQSEANELLSGLELHSKGRRNDASQEPLLRFANSNNSNGKACDGSTIHTRSKKRSMCILDGCTRPAPVNGCVFHACKFCCTKLQSPISKFLGGRAQICPAHNSGAVTTNERKNAQTASANTKLKSHDKDSCNHGTITSAAKVLLSGVGADEQMAGYGRHRTTFQRGGYLELKDELQMEVRRLWTRNLGRDDRCLSDCGKEGERMYLFHCPIKELLLPFYSFTHKLVFRIWTRMWWRT
jgi:asparagine synthetase B (glutamine-hydrolysing)